MGAVIVVLAVVAVQFTLLFLVGVAVLSPATGALRRLLLPISPLLGAVTIAVISSTTSRFAPAWLAVVVTVVLCLGLVLLARRRAERPFWFGRSALPDLAVSCVLSMGALVVGLVPTHWVGDNRAASSGDSLDIFYYTAEADWLESHAAVPGPQIIPAQGAHLDSFAFEPMQKTLEAHLRFGQPAVHAALNTVMRMDAWSTVTPMALLWLLLIAPAAFVGARLFGLGRIAAAFVGLVTVSSATVSSQFAAGNVDGLLGVSVALLAVVLGGSAIAGRVPVWLGALLVAGVIAIYTEYAVLVAPALALAVLTPSLRQVGRRVARAAGVAGAAVIVTPYATADAARSLAVSRGGDGHDWVSPFFSDGLHAAVARALGFAAFREVPPSSDLLVYGAAVVVVLGGLSALVLLPQRAVLIGLVLSGGYLVASATIDRSGYLQLRAVQLTSPLAWFVAGLGLALLAHRVRLCHRRIWAALLAALVGLAWSAPNLVNAYQGLSPGVVVSRHPDISYDQAAQWVRDVGPENVTLMVPDITIDVWMMYALRHLDGVNYPVVQSSYLGGLPDDDGSHRRYALLGPGAWLVKPETVVRRNQRFRLVDLDAGATVVTPTNMGFGWNPFVGGGNIMNGTDGNQLLVVSGPAGAGALRLRINTQAFAGRRLVATVDGSVVGEVVGGVGLTDLVVDLKRRTRATIRLDVDGDGVDSTVPLGLARVRSASRAAPR